MHTSVVPFVLAALSSSAADPIALRRDTSAALTAWRSSYGARWTAEVDAASGRAELIYGGVAAWPDVPRTDDEWIARARVAVGATRAMHGVDPSSLVRARVQLLPLGLAGSGDKWAVVLQQEIAGIRVHGGTVSVLLDARGALLSIHNHALAHADGLEVEPLRTRAEARDRAVQTFEKEQGERAASVVDGGLVILPVDGAGGRVGRLAWETTVQSGTEDGQPVGRRSWTDARSGRLLLEESSVHSFDLTGTISVMATPGTRADSASNPETLQPVKYMRVPYPGGAAHTDANGAFTIPGNSAQNVQLIYSGLWSDVVDALSFWPLAQTVQLLPGVNNAVVLNANSVDAFTAHANILNHTGTVRDYVRRVTPTDDTADRVFAARANFNSTCNAFYAGDSVYFYAAGGACNNTGFSTVVAHELGHWLNDLYGTFNRSDGIGEGTADIMSLYVYDTAITGQDFYANGAYVRSGTNLRQYCGDCRPGCHDGAHADGEPWMGAAWKIRTRLNASLGDVQGDLVADQLFMGWLNAFDQRELDSVIELQWLLLDDDDGDLTNGTPHRADIRGGFAQHGFPGRGIQFTHVDTIVDPTCERASYPVTANVRNVFGTPITSVTLSYGVDGGALVDVPMTATGGDAWSGAIPHVASPATVEYRVRARDATGATKDGFCGTRTFFLGDVVAFASEGFETANGWTHASVGDTPNALDDWQRGAPQGRMGSSGGTLWLDPPAAASGTSCIGNDVGIPGANIGEGAYNAEAHCYFQSPPFDCTGRTGVQLVFERWLTVEKSLYDVARVLANGVEVWRNPPDANVVDTAWTTQTIDVSAIADGNPSVTIRFELLSDASVNLGGWQIDDVRLGRVAALPSCSPGTSFCAGDGSGAPCPCANESALGAGEGCRNSFGSGAKLAATGGASVAADTLVLAATQMPNSSALYFQGTAQANGGAGTAFGDGLRCAATGVVRLGTKLNVGGSSRYPDVGDASVSVRGLVPAGGATRHYQVWYRNAASFCTNSTFNLSNGTSVAWSP